MSEGQENILKRQPNASNRTRNSSKGRKTPELQQTLSPIVVASKLKKIKENLNPTKDRDSSGIVEKSICDYIDARNESIQNQSDSNRFSQKDQEEISSSYELLSRNRPTTYKENDVSNSNRKSYVNFITSKLEYTKSSDDVNRKSVAIDPKVQNDTNLAKSQTLDCIDFELGNRFDLTQ